MNRLFVVLLGVVVFGMSVRDCAAQARELSIEDIRAVWQARQDKIKTVKVDWTSEETIHKGSSTIFAGRDPRIPANTEPSPPRDYSVQGSGSLILTHGKLRYTHHNSMWNVRLKHLYSVQHDESVIGDSLRSLDNPGSGEAAYPHGFVELAKRSQAVAFFGNRPLMLHLCSLSEPFSRILDLSKWEIGRQEVLIGRINCIELVQKHKANSNQPSVFLDREREFNVVREEIRSTKNVLLWTINTSFVADSTVGWMPNKWEYVIRTFPPDIQESGSRTVVRYMFNEKLDDSSFDLQFPPGTRVFDQTDNKNLQEYAIDDDGRALRGLPSAKNPTMEDLREQPMAPSGMRWTWFVGAALLFVVSVIALLWLRRRRESMSSTSANNVFQPRTSVTNGD